MSKAEELIACLEGEIAKRDEELAACRVAVENCEVFRARIAELEARYQRDVYGLNNEGDPIGGDPAGGYANDNARLRSELAAIKAQGVVMPDVNAAAKALCNRHAMICGVDADDQWKEYSQDFIADAETVLANARLNAAPVQQVSDDELLEAACHQGNGNKARRRAEAIAAQAHLGSVAPSTDGYVRTPVKPTEAMVFAGCAALVGSIGGYEAGLVERCYDAMLAAAPAAPAADALLVEALELAANRLDRLAMEHDEFWRGYATMWVREARAALADHRAKGVV